MRAARNFIASLFAGDDEEVDELKTKVMKKTVKKNIARLRLAVGIRREISAIYRKYHSLSRLAQSLAKRDFRHYDVKRAVDAIHYYGGGWPHPSSKGRMESLCDAFTGMYRILHFIGEGRMVEDHLAKSGIQVKLLKHGQIKNTPIHPDIMEQIKQTHGIQNAKDLREVLEQVIMICTDLQKQVCDKADVIKDTIRPEVKDELGLDSPEYNRLTEVVKLKQGGERTQARASRKLKTVDESFDGFHMVAEELRVQKIEE